ncbi:phage tail protein [Celerinatantimonas sp. YJH-8]|uniref:phage tail protein n=1 Tax=Celerinatantimonas sp. YJH-8 TaxID=3228714 RepID=UPI0038C5F994
MNTFFTILTQQGATKLTQASSQGQTIALSQMALGDGNGNAPTPDPAQTVLVHEVYRAALNAVSLDPQHSNQMICELIIPETEGGFTIRECGLYDSDGHLFAIGNCPETYKPRLSEGSGRTQTIRMILAASAIESVELMIDPAIVLASREYVKQQDSDLKAYVDSQDANYQASAKTDATNKANQALTDAKSYAQQQDTSLKSYVDSQDETVLASAKSDATSRTNGALSSAKSYADTQDATILDSAKSYSEDAGNLKKGTIATERLPEGTVLASIDSQINVVDANSADALPFGCVRFTSALVTGATNTDYGYDGLKIGIAGSYKIIAWSYASGKHVGALYTRDDDTWSRILTQNLAATLAEVLAGEDTLTYVSPAQLNHAGIVPSLGAGQTRTIYTVGTDRILGTTYTNSSNRPLWLNLFFGNGTNHSNLSVTLNGSVYLSSEDIDQSNDLSNASLSFLILPGETYSIDYDGNGNLYWMEIV